MTLNASSNQWTTPTLYCVSGVKSHNLWIFTYKKMGTVKTKLIYFNFVTFFTCNEITDKCRATFCRRIFDRKIFIEFWRFDDFTSDRFNVLDGFKMWPLTFVHLIKNIKVAKLKWVIMCFNELVYQGDDTRLGKCGTFQSFKLTYLHVLRS